jgi:hypothetical protein
LRQARHLRVADHLAEGMNARHNTRPPFWSRG